MMWTLPPNDHPIWTVIPPALRVMQSAVAVIGIGILVWHLHTTGFAHPGGADYEEGAGLIGTGFLAKLAFDLFKSRQT